MINDPTSERFPPPANPPEKLGPQTEPEYLADKGKVEARERFLRRREGIEKKFLENPPKIENVKTPEGGDIRVISQAYVFPEADRSQEAGSKSAKVLVYIPGLSDIKGHDLGSVPETNIAGFVDGDTAAVIMVKPEGTNAKAYTGVPDRPQQRTSEAATDRIIQYLDEFRQKPGFEDVTFNIAGLSEGSPLAISIAARMIEKIQKGDKTIAVGRVESFGAGGLIGQTDISKTGAVDLAKNIARALSDSAASAKFYGEKILEQVKGPHGSLARHSLDLGDGKRYVSGQAVGATGKEALTGGLEGALGQRVQDLKVNDKNFMREMMPIIADGLKIPSNAPFERIAAVMAGNQADVETVAKANIPTVFFTATKDIFFPEREISAAIDQLRARFKGWEPLQVAIGGMEHKGFHEAAQGVAAVGKAIVDAQPAGWRQRVYRSQT